VAVVELRVGGALTPLSTRKKLLILEVLADADVDAQLVGEIRLRWAEHKVWRKVMKSHPPRVALDE